MNSGVRSCSSRLGLKLLAEPPDGRRFVRDEQLELLQLGDGRALPVILRNLVRQEEHAVAFRKPLPQPASNSGPLIGTASPRWTWNAIMRSCSICGVRSATTSPSVGTRHKHRHVL